MWIPKSLLALLNISKDSIDSLRSESIELRAKNEILERELASCKIMADWLRVMFNQLSAERVKLMERAYPGLNLPAPEIARVTRQIQEGFDLQALFEHQPDASDADFIKAN